MADFISTLQGLVRGSTIPFYNDGQQAIPGLNSRGELLVARALPERSELVRMGNSWGAQIKDANAFTALITIPTTLASLSLQNGEATGGKSYLIDRVWVKAVTTLAAANYLAILAQVVAAGTALVADSANKTIQSLSGKTATYNGRAQLAVASTATGCLTDKWACIGNTLSLPTSTSIAAFGEAFVYGRYVIPPQASFNMSAQEAVSGGTLIMGVEWHEVQLVLG